MVSEKDVRALIRDGIDIARSGDKKLAHAMLAEATRLDPQNEKAWLWLAGVAPNIAEAADCLQHVLKINPQNQTAIKGLERLGVQPSVSEPETSGGNGSKPYPADYHEAETVRSGSNVIGSSLSSAALTRPTGARAQLPERVRELETKLDQMEPLGTDQAEGMAVGIDHPEKMAPVPNVEEEHRTLRILIVDDSPTIRKLVSMTLGKHGYEVVSAADGMEALARINDGAPDLILLDITMPRMDGYQLCKTIKSNEAIEHIPIVMLTGKDGFMDKVRGRMVGSEGYLTKPFNPEALVRMVNERIGAA